MESTNPAVIGSKFGTCIWWIFKPEYHVKGHISFDVLFYTVLTVNARLLSVFCLVSVLTSMVGQVAKLLPPIKLVGRGARSVNLFRAAAAAVTTTTGKPTTAKKGSAPSASTAKLVAGFTTTAKSDGLANSTASSVAILGTNATLFKTPFGNFLSVKISENK